jgi:predicted glycoside hydrolase/deacetylase ChbG (UPF0249 family)
MSNGDFFKEAVKGLEVRTDLNVGIHLNLTYGKALKSDSLFTDDKGIFNLGYFDILLKSMQSKVFLVAVKEEFEAQIVHLLDAGLTLSHIDSHRHIHLIPKLYDIVIELAKKYNINRVRMVNENILTSMSVTKKCNFIVNGGLIKFFLLKIFTKINMKKENFYKNISFYSILYTGVVEKDIFKQLYKKNNLFEVMVHPGIGDLDKDIFFYSEDEKKYRLSPNREKELKAVMQKNIS